MPHTLHRLPGVTLVATVNSSLKLSWLWSPLLREGLVSVDERTLLSPFVVVERRRYGEVILEGWGPKLARLRI